MIRRVFAMSAAVALAAATAHAEPAGGTMSQRAVDVKNPEQLIKQWADAVSAFNAPILQAEDLVKFADDGVHQAVALMRAHADRATADAWALPWRKTIDDKIAALRAAAAAAPFPDALAARMIAADPKAAGPISAERGRLPQAREHIIADSTSFASSMGDDMVKAAEGDRTAPARVAANIITGSREVVQAENTMLEVSITSTPPDSPQLALIKSTHATNQICIDVISAVETSRMGLPVDRAALAKDVHDLAAQARTDAAQAPELAARQKAKLAPSLASNSRLAAKINAFLDTYGESATVEQAVADRLGALETPIARGDDLLKMLGTLQDIDPLMQRRIALQNIRAADLAN